MPTRLHPVTAASIAHAPPPCVGCVFWQSRGDRAAAKGRWAERIEDDWGPWGTLYFEEEDRLLGFIQYGPAGHFPRADDMPAGPPSDDAVLITCAYLVDATAPWAIQSLFLSVIGEARDRKAKAIETFAYRYPEGESPYERFLVHRTIFPSDFLADLGFYPVRWEGDVALARLELGGLQPVAEGSTALLWRRVKEVLTPAPVPQRPRPWIRPGSRRRSRSASAICTAFRAAPLRRLSFTLQSARPEPFAVSGRMRPTRTSSRPAASFGVASSCSAT